MNKKDYGLFDVSQGKNAKEKAALSVAQNRGALNKANSTIKTTLEKKEQRIKEYRKEASRLVSMANKRLIRLEDNKLTDSPAYKKLVGDKGKKPRFGIRGKDYNELQKEVAKMQKFINSTTSTVRGTNNLLKEMAKTTGLKYKNLADLRAKANTFFELSSKIEQYLRNVEDIGSLYDSARIFSFINEYVQETKVDLANASENIDDMVHKIIDAIDIYDEKEQLNINHNGVKITGWYTLPKE